MVEERWVPDSDKEAQRNYEAQRTISAILKLALEPISLEEQLLRTLDLLLAIPWLALESKGCVFVVEEEGKSLRLAAQRGLPAPLLEQCAKVKFGHCLCGKAAAEGTLVFASHVDHRHDVKLAGSSDHGHYCFPIQTGERIVGVLNLYVRAGHEATEIEVDFLQAVTNTLAGLVERKRAELAMQQAKDDLQITVENLRISLEPISLKDQLERTLELLLSLPWLSLEKKGGVFLFDNETELLRLVVSKGLPDALVTKCNNVPVGVCLCGMAAAEKKVIFCSNVTKDHHHRFKGMVDHGHYCVPILIGERVLGVIVAYVPAGHVRSRAEEELLKSVAGTLAGAIERNRTQGALQRAKDDLETALHERTVKLDLLHHQNRLILDAVGEGVCGIDGKGKTTFVNPAAAAATGYDPADMVGRDFHELMHHTRADGSKNVRETCPVCSTCRSGEAHQVTDEVFWRRDGSQLPVDYVSMPLMSRGEVSGAVVTFRDVSERRRAEIELRQSLDRLGKALHGTVDALSIAAESRDPYTAGHQRRVAQLACAIARRKGMTEESIEWVRVAALLHDIGKISVPAEYLAKPKELTSIERDVMKTHPQVGYDILRKIDFGWPVADVVLQHHERLDGSGYPLGLAGDAILPESRILSVADIVEAMASHRPYRPALGIDRALEEISRYRGIYLDTDVVDICLELFRERAFTLESAH